MFFNFGDFNLVGLGVGLEVVFLISFLDDFEGLLDLGISDLVYIVMFYWL